MKLDPITYSERYDNSSGDHNVKRGFDPYRNEQGEYIIERKVTLYPRTWNKGFCLALTITEDYTTPTFTTTDDKGVQYLNGGERKTRKLVEQWVYDYPHPDDPQKLTYEQIRLLMALACGELRGEFADNIATDFYIDVFVRDPDPESPVRKYLPQVAKFWDNHWAKLKEQNEDSARILKQLT